MSHIRTTLVAVLAFGAIVRLAGAADGGVEFFESRIRPVLVEKCNRCHSAGEKSPKGGLRLDSVSGLRKGGDSGAAIVPGKVDESLLVDAIAHEGGVAEMPPDSKLPDRVIEDFRHWVQIGAPLPDEKSQASAAAGPKIDLVAARQFWSLKPALQPSLPAVSDPKWVRNRIDSFVLKGLDDHKMRPSLEADRRTLIRRVTFDLIGLAPTWDEVQAFVQDQSADAYEKVVNRLLASPRYGERWGRHWLDVARYAEDNPTGEATNRPPKNPHVYRDWVINALNADIPYDEFVRRQLAADLMPNLPPSEHAALGFLGLAPVYHKEPRLSADVIGAIVADEWDERIDTITRGFLGLTVACARCHDHKFDPISTADYYALAGVMASTQQVDRALVPISAEKEEKLATRRVALVDAQLRVGTANEMKATFRKDKEARAKFDKKIAEFQARLDTLRREPDFDGPTAPAVRDAALWVNGSDPSWTWLEFKRGASRDLPVFIRGNVANHGAIVPRRLPSVLYPAAPKSFGQGSGRKELADGIVNEGASLAGRVIVNRVWGWHFGRPLVTTPSNFGKLGDAPSHPELLDDLTARFIAGGWSLKNLHREIVTSATYRQASTGTREFITSDPENKWLSRANRNRLDVEAWRDGVLQAAGALNDSMGGPSSNVEDPSFRRRTVYGRVARQRVPDIFRWFDFPDANRHGEARDATTTPLQQLYFLNSPLLLTNANRLARVILTQPLSRDEYLRLALTGRANGRKLSSQEYAEAILTRTTGDRRDAPEAVITRLYRRVLLRPPTTAESARALKLVESEGGVDAREAWAVLAQAVLISNEFLFVD